MNAAQAPEHFIDLEWADLVGTLPSRRYDFIRALAVAQAAHPDLPLTPEKGRIAALRDHRGMGAAEGGDATVSRAEGEGSGYEAC